MKLKLGPLAALLLLPMSFQALSAEGMTKSLAGTGNLETLQALQPETNGGVYVGMGFGKARNRLDTFDSRYRNHTDPALKVFAGLAYNKYLAMELAYLGIDTERGTQQTVSVSLTRPSFMGSAVGTLPLSESLHLQAKLGFASYEASTNSNFGGRSERKNDWTYGVIATVNLGQHFGIRTEYEAIGVSNGVYDVLSLSGVFKF